VALQIARSAADGVAVLAVRGDLDIEGGSGLRQALLEAIGQHPGGRVVVDLEGVDFIDSAGLGVLLGGLKRARTDDGDLVLVATGKNVLKVFELTRLTRVFQIYSTRAAALDAPA
jgi:anti-sigma B factor antagonist